MRNISDVGIKLIKSFEGCKLTAYKCVPTEQYLTIGWGHYGKDVTLGMKISQAQADSLLLHDLAKFVAYVNLIPLELNQNQFDALCSFTYNCGEGSLQKLCLGRTITQIAEHMLLYNKSGGKVLSGLVKRRQKEHDLFVK